MTSAKRTLKPPVVQAQPVYSSPTDIREPDDKEVVMQKDEMVGPLVIAGIEETMHTAAYHVRYLSLLALVTKGTGPGEVPDMVRAKPVRPRCDMWQSIFRVVLPKVGRDDMFDVELADGGLEAVLARIPSTQTHHFSNNPVVRAVFRLLLQVIQ